MLTSSIVGFGGSNSITQITVPEIITPSFQFGSKINVEKEDEDASRKKITVEDYIKTYFSDIPIMIEVAKCESRFRQHNERGEVLRGEQNSFDLGVMQINESYHGEDARKLGYDIMTLEGNTSYARYLFEKYGVKPWSSSSGCWSKTVAYTQYKTELAMK